MIVHISCLDQLPGELMKGPAGTAEFISDSHFGIGSGGLVLIFPSKIAVFKMRMLNSDGSETDMCGNDIRCVGKYVYDNGFTEKNSVTARQWLAGRVPALF